MSTRLWSLVILSLVAWLAASCGKSDNGPSGPVNPADTTAPFIMRISPDSNDFNVTPSVHLVVTASEKLNPATITSGSVVLTGGGSSDTVRTTLSCVDSVITVTPNAPLLNNGLYELEVTRAVEDEAGNGLRAVKRFAFGVEPYTTARVDTWVRRIRRSLMSPDIELSAVTVRQDGSYAVSGSNFSGGSGIYVAGLDTAGKVSWLQWYYKATLIIGEDLMERQDGFLVGCGIGVGPSETGFVYGTTQLGTPAFDYSYTGQTWAELYSIIETSNYGAVTCGSSGTKAYLVKTTGYGGPVWERYLGAGEYRGRGLAAIGTGFLLCGSQGVSPTYGLVIKTDDTGVAVWENTYGTGTFEDIVSLGDGTFGIVGSTSSGQILVVDIDSSGTEQWRTEVGSGSGHSIAALSDGGCVIAGENNNMVVLARLSSAGSLTWRRDTINGRGLSVAIARDDGYVIAAGLYIIKTDENGNL